MIDFHCSCEDCEQARLLETLIAQEDAAACNYNIPLNQQRSALDGDARLEQTPEDAKASEGNTPRWLAFLIERILYRRL